MSTTTDPAYVRPGETRANDEYERDLIHDLGRRLSCLWAYDRCIAMATGRPELLEFWHHVKTQEQTNIDRLKQLIRQDDEGDCC